MTADGKRKLCVSGIVAGAVLFFGAPMIGLTGTVLGMLRAFHELGGPGVGDPTKLSNAIGQVLNSTIIGVVLAVPGLVLLIVSLVLFLRGKRQAALTESDATP